MKTRITLQGRAYFSFITLILLLTFSLASINTNAQVFYRGDENGWSEGSMTYRDLGTDSYIYTYLEGTGGNRQWKFADAAYSDWWGFHENITNLNVRQDWWYHSGGNGNIVAALTSGKYYSVIWKEVAANNNSEGYIFETSATPVTINSVTQLPLAADVTTSTDVVVTVTTSATPSAEEKLYVCYTVDGGSNQFALVTAGQATIAAQTAGAVISYHVISTCVADISAEANTDLATLNYNNNGGSMYTYTSVLDPTGAPVAEYSPVNNATDIAINVNPTLTFDRDVFATDGSSFADGADVSSMLTLSETVSTSSVAFSATITGKIITIVPTNNLKNNLGYTIKLNAGSVENALGTDNEESSSTFTTIVKYVDVTFNVNMRDEVYTRGWDPATKNIDVIGSWDSWTTGITMTDGDGDLIYTATLPNKAVGTALEFKYRKESAWNGTEESNNRSYTIIDGTNSPSAWYNDIVHLVEADFLTFTMAEQADDAVIDKTAKTIAIDVVFGTPLTNLVPTFTLSDGATANIASGVGRDFSSEVVYTITPYDGSAATDWKVNVTALAALNTEAEIISFSFNEQTGPATINSSAATIDIEVAYDADINNLTPAITISGGATIDPLTAVAQDFSSTFDYTVSPEDPTASDKVWTVNVTQVASYNVALSVNMKKQYNLGNFDPTTDTVSISGNFNGWSDNDTIHDTNGDLIYTYTTKRPEGYVFEYKFRRHEGSNIIWETSSNRPLTVVAGTNTDTAWFQNIAGSSNANLSNLTVDGTTITGFDASVLTYKVLLSPGTTTIPTVAGISADANAIALPNQASTIPGDATVVVTAEDGSTKQTYTVSFDFKSTDASLSDLTVTGTTIEGFTPATVAYTMELAYGTTAVPTVEATTNYVNAKAVITATESLPGTTRIVVTAEDGSTAKTYTIDFTLAASNVSTLSDIKVDAKTIDNFDAATESYSIELPYGSISVPQVTATTTDENAHAVVTDATQIPGTTSILVTAEDAVATTTYSVIFTIAAPSSDASLSDIQVDDVSITDFKSDSLEYSIALPFGTTVLPAIECVKTDSNATFIVTQPSALPGTALIVVTAQDNSTKKTYSIKYTIAPPSNDASLSDLAIDNLTLLDFNSDSVNYSIELPFGTMNPPVVSAKTTHDSATMVITQATTVSDTAIVVITAQDGSTKSTYSIVFSVALYISDDATLRDIKIDSISITDFASDIFMYSIELPMGTTTVPKVEGISTNTAATVVVSNISTLLDTAVITVTAQDSVTIKIYKVAFTVADPVYDVTFTVSDGSKGLIEGAQIVFMLDTLVTSINGVAVFSSVSPTTDASYAVTKEGYLDVDGSLSVIDANVEQAITMTLKSYDVKFIVVDASNAAIANAELVFQKDTMNTDSSGIAIFKSIIPVTDAAYTISKDGFISTSGKLSVVDTAVVENVTLQLKTYELKFNIVDASSNPVEAATVVFQNDTIATDTLGIALFSSIAPVNNAKYSVIKDSYFSITDSLSIIDSNVVVSLMLELETYNVMFIVIDIEDNPVVDASVQLQGETATTDALGVVEFNLVPISDAAFSVTKDGYLDESGTVSVIDTAVEVSVTLKSQSYTVAFTVIDNDQNPVVDAEVSFNGSSILTDANGLAEFLSVNPVSDAEYSVSKDGYEAASGTLSVVHADVELSVQLLVLGIGKSMSFVGNIYPNPTNGEITIQLSSNVSEATLELFDIKGKMVKKAELNKMETIFDLSNNKSGIYLLKVVTENDQHIRKIILK